MKITNRLSKVILPLFSLLVFIFSGCSESQKSEVELIKSLEIQRLKALVDADVKSANSIHGEDFELINPSGRVSSKSEYLGMIEAGTLDYDDWIADEGSMRVRMYDNTAAMRYMDKELKVLLNGQPVWSGSVQHTNLYEKRNGQWKLIWSHASGGEDLRAKQKSHNAQQVAGGDATR